MSSAVERGRTGLEDWQDRGEPPRRQLHLGAGSSRSGICRLELPFDIPLVSTLRVIDNAASGEPQGDLEEDHKDQGGRGTGGGQEPGGGQSSQVMVMLVILMMCQGILKKKKT